MFGDAVVPWFATGLIVSLRSIFSVQLEAICPAQCLAFIFGQFDARPVSNRPGGSIN